MQIHELTDEMTSIADAGNYLAVDNGVVTSKIDYLRLAKAIIEVYNGSSINGSNQTLQTAIAGIQGQIDDSYITADTYVDFYNQCTALPNGKLVTFACEGAVSSKITGGAVTAALKGFIQKTDASTNRFDFFGYVDSGYMYAYRCQFVSSSEVVVQYSKSTQTLESDINALTSKIKFLRADISASGNVSSLITTIIPMMTAEGEYYFHGSWTTHTYGYSAHCWRRPYSDSVTRYSGVVIAHDGNVWTFSANSTSDVVVNAMPRNVDISSQITLTAGTNCGSVTLTSAMKYGNILFIRFTVTPSGTIASGGNLDVTFSGFTPAVAADFRLLAGVSGIGLYQSWLVNTTTIRCRRIADTTWTSSTPVIFSGIILCTS